MKRKINKVVASILVGIMVFSLAACGAKAPAPVEEQPAVEEPAEEPAVEEPAAQEEPAASGETLTVAIWDSYQEPGLRKIMDDFTAETGIKAEIQVTPWGEYWTMLEAGATGGNLPDVFWMHSNEIGKYAEYDMLLDLTDKISADGVDLANYPEDIVNLYKNANGAQLALPKDIDTVGLWYNKTMFDEAGIAYPDASWDWEQLAETAKKLTKDDGSQYGMHMSPPEYHPGFFNTIYAYNGEIINADKTKSGFDKPETIEAMKLVESMIKDGSMPPANTIAEVDPVALLTSGKIAMVGFGSWMITTLIENEYVQEHCDIAVLPKGPDGRRPTIYNGLGWAAAGNTSNPDEAWALIKYMTSKEAQQKQADLGVTMSAFKGVSDAFVNSNPDFNVQAYIDMMDDMVLLPYSKSTVAWMNMMQEKLVPVWEGSAGMEETCKSIAEEMNTMLAEE